MSEINIENGWLLDQDLGEARVVTQDDVKFYRHRAILGYLEGASTIASLVCVNPVKVESDDGKVIGTANVRLTNGKVLAELVIDYSTPERLAAETRDGVRHWVRIVGGLQTQPSINFVDVGEALQLVLTVNKLVLSTKRPLDRRLLPFGEPVL